MERSDGDPGDAGVGIRALGKNVVLQAAIPPDDEAYMLLHSNPEIVLLRKDLHDMGVTDIAIDHLFNEIVYRLRQDIARNGDVDKWGVFRIVIWDEVLARYDFLKLFADFVELMSNEITLRSVVSGNLFKAVYQLWQEIRRTFVKRKDFPNWQCGDLNH